MLIPLARRFPEDVHDLTWHAVLAHRALAARAGVVSPELRRVADRRVDQRRLRPSRGLGAGALRLSGQAIVDALVDLPFALPTAVAGIALTALYAPNGWIGRPLAAARDQGRLHAAGRDRRADLHRAAVRRAHRAAGARGPRPGSSRRPPPASARPLADLLRVHPADDLPAALTGFALAFARALGEYGSVIFIAGNMPMKTEITPLLIITKLEQYDYAARPRSPW